MTDPTPEDAIRALGLTEAESAYLAAIDAEAVRTGYMPEGESLVAATGPETWLEPWRENPALTPEQQVATEISYAAESESGEEVAR